MTGRDPMDDYAVINGELAAYNAELAQLPQVLVLNKADVADPEALQTVREELEAEGETVFVVSAATRAGLEPLVYHLAEQLAQMPLAAPAEDEILRITPDTHGKRRLDRRWEATHSKADGVFLVTGQGIERLVSMTDLANEDAVSRLQRVLDKSGIVRKLRALGAGEGDTVRIGNAEFDFFDEDALDQRAVDEEDEDAANSD